MRSRLILAGLGLAVLAFGAIALRAQESTPPKGQDSSQVREDIAASEQQIARQFAEFEQLLLRLKQRLERSNRKEDKARAEVLARVLEESRGLGVQVKFERLQDFLRGNKKINDVGTAKELRLKTEKIAEDLRTLLDRLREDPRGRKVQEEIAKLKEIIKDLEKNIYQQKEVQGRTDLGKTDAKELQQNQQQVSKKTEGILNKLDKLLGKDGKGQGGEGKQQPGAPKDGPKGEGKAGESKGEGKAGEQPRGESKSGGEGSKEAKGEAKSGQESGGKKGGEGQEGEAGKKGGQGAEGQAKEKGSKSGEAGKGQGKEKGAQAGEKSSQGGAKGAGEQKGAPKGGQAGAKGSQGGKKGGEGGKKGGEGQAKSGGEGGKKGGQAGAKGSQGGQKGGQQGAQKGGEQKQQQAGKHGKTKTGEKGDAQAKNDGSKQGGEQGGKKGGQQASAKGSKGGQGGQKGGEQGGQKGGDQDDDGQKGGSQKEKDQIASSKKRVQEGNYQQKGAEDALKKTNNKTASEKQGNAIKELEAAKERLERLLRQLREEEMERVLAQLQARCEKMLAMQMAVLAGTEATHKGVQATSDKKATRAHQQESLKLSDNEKEIISEANKAIEMLEAEGSAVAFPEVFQQVREDMKHVQRRLEITDIGPITQGIERDIIDTLKEMIDALKKARQENEQSKGQPKEGKQGNPADQKLLDQIAELKMIRSMQLRVNARTKLYGRQYQEREGEQTANPTIQRELNNLAERQERIFEVTNRIAKGDNR